MSDASKYVPLLALISLLGACEVGTGDSALASYAPIPDGGGYGGAAAPEGSVLSLADGSPEEIFLGYGKREVIKVVLRGPDGDPVEGASVRFALVDGEVAGSSLLDVEVRTLENGEAQTSLSSGSSEADFRVRVSAVGVESLYVRVRVTTAPITVLTVGLSYEGDRAIETFRVRVFEDLPCEAFANGLTAHDAYERTNVDGQASSATLSLRTTDAPLVLQITAVGPASNVVATYCGPLDGMGEETASILASLTDTSLDLASTYSLQANLDVSASAERLADAILASLDVTAADPTAPSGLRLLNAVQDTLLAEGEVDDANWVLSQKPTLAPELEQQLDDAERGLTVAMTSLAGAVRRTGAKLVVHSQLSASGTSTLELAYQPRELLAEGGSAPVRLRFGSGYDEMGVPGTITADLDTTMSILQIDALRLDLGLGHYGDALLHGLADGPEGSQREALLVDLGCAELAAWAASESMLYEVCDDTCLEASCERALDTLLDDTREQLSALDGDHAGVALRGNLPVYDVTGSGVARLVETAEMRGSWGRAADAMEPDEVTGTLGTAPATTGP